MYNHYKTRPDKKTQQGDLFLWYRFSSLFQRLFRRIDSNPRLPGWKEKSHLAQVSDLGISVT